MGHEGVVDLQDQIRGSQDAEVLRIRLDGVRVPPWRDVVVEVGALVRMEVCLRIAVSLVGFTFWCKVWGTVCNIAGLWEWRICYLFLL